MGTLSRYRLRTLLVVLALGPPVLAGAWMFTRAPSDYPLVVFLPFYATIALGLLIEWFAIRGKRK
jgi:hypothetical protein